MAEAKKCDLCGELYEPYSLSRKENYYNQRDKTTNTYLYEIKTSILNGQKIVEYDLCKECLKRELKSFCDNL